jgi:hypothetical protein
MDRPAISPVNIRVKPHIVRHRGWWVVHRIRGMQCINGIGDTPVQAFNDYVANMIPWGIRKGGPYYPNTAYRRG